MSIEEWRDCPGHPGYEVSSVGRVRSLRSKSGKILERGNEHVMRPFRAHNGYMRFSLRNRTEKPQKRAAHHLVLEAFVGACPVGMEACHNNGDPADNRVENLRWDTRPNNYNDQRLHGTAPVGTKHYCAKVDEDIVRRMRARFAAGEAIAAIARDIGMTPQSARKVVLKRSWKCVA